MKLDIRLTVCIAIVLCALVGTQAASNSMTNSAPETYLLPASQLLESAEKILYKKTPQEDLYLYLLRPTGKRDQSLPAIIYFTGGGWVNGQPTGMIGNAAWFRDRGLIGISADYRVKKRHNTTPIECIKDAKSAIRYVRAHAVELGVDPNRIIAGGGSAGGHLAAATYLDCGDETSEDASISTKPNAIVLHNPVLGKGHGEVFFNEHPEFSPLKGVRKGWPPTILSCGTADPTTPFSGAKQFYAAMKKAGNKCELIPVEGAKHSCDWPVSNPDFLPTIMRMEAFLREQNIIP